MSIQKITIKNFRLLENVDITLENRTTVIVGRNNSGKTSLTELFKRLLSEQSPSFRLEDFSLSVHDEFWNAFLLYKEGKDEIEIRKVLPRIELNLTISYDKNNPILGPLGNFIIDLDPSCSTTLVKIRYQLKNGEIDKFFEDINYEQTEDIDSQMNFPFFREVNGQNGSLDSDDSQKKTFFHTIKENDRVKKFYDIVLLAEDVNDSNNQKVMEWRQIHLILQSGFINAQRGIDDTTHKDINLLGKIFESLLTSAMSDFADEKDHKIVQNLENAIENMRLNINDGFNKQLDDLLPTFELFGYPGLTDPKLKTETKLDVERLLKNHTKVHYAGINGINLPESYNGLGVRNLIFILLKLLEYFKAFISREVAPNIHLIFIEEPEVHLHPQMQEVFINKINEIVEVFSKTFTNGTPWPIQFVITTHSSHLANRASFESIRYFFTTSVGNKENIRKTQIKDLNTGLMNTSPVNKEFLHKYMTLTRCDLLFADKAILIEGTTERLMLPEMIKKVEESFPDRPKLSSQYISIVEVGGAYAHLFFNLLNFLELKTLIITDLDSTKKNENNHFTLCKVSEGTRTSNSSLKKWFGNQEITPTELIHKTDEDKIHGIHRIAYQIPEPSERPCGRSFEEAFILANLTLFEVNGTSAEEIEMNAIQTTTEEVNKKTDFALKYGIHETQWNVPRYISEGLCWLAEGGRITNSPSIYAPLDGNSGLQKQDNSHD
ncbi:MAG: ATP-dependent endonuclease [Candidatus Auribacter fodinae]|uniref:ATP-dependent endonuclease n=1 Tax=Candidatus Auribacter fodinae TaxID=2093366 RepID=A0A3A4R651_9BACT|nr:MAG: ATP-dependent endonuclease [Candidatus Auribacter fodinae]